MRQFTFALLLLLIVASDLALAEVRKSESIDETSRELKRFRDDTKLSVVMIDVNSTKQQGDAILLSEPNGKTVLMDTGHKNQAQSALIPFLKKMKVRQIDQVIVTHPHWDHYGGLGELIASSNFVIKEIVMGQISSEKCESEAPGCSISEIEKIRSIAQKKRIPIIDLKSWSEIEFKNGARLSKIVQFDELNTPLDRTDINDLSLISALEYRNSRILFTGDLNSPLSEWLIKNKPDQLKSDILKVPHHGAEGCASNAFFKKVAPKQVLVPSPAKTWCTGRSKRIRKVVNTLNAPAFVNGLHGDVFVYLNETGATIEPMRGDERNPDCRDLIKKGL